MEIIISKLTVYYMTFKEFQNKQHLKTALDIYSIGYAAVTTPHWGYKEGQQLHEFSTVHLNDLGIFSPV